MTFGFPAFFWAALSLIPLAAVYFIRTRPRRQPVNTFFLWQRVFQQKAASSLFQKLRNLLSLLLLALAFLAAVFALTRPRFDSGETPDLLIIIDRSASMQATQDGETRLDLAKERAESWITALSGSQRAAIASVADKLEYHANLTTRSRRLTEALDSITESELALNPNSLGELALLTNKDADASTRTRILFLTDSQSPEMLVPDGIEIVNVGDDLGNIGITAADLRWDAPGKATLFTTLSSTFPEDREIEMEVISANSDQTLARLFTIKVPANDQASESIALDSIDPGAWLLRANTEDSLAADNTAPIGLNSPQAIPVQVKAENPFFFNQVISAFSRADSLFEPIEDFARLSLSQGNPPDTETAVIFAPAGESSFWENLGSELPPGPPEILSPDHPLLARVDPTLLTFDGARELEAPEGAVVVLTHTNGTPLLYTLSKSEKSAVVFNFDPSQNDFFISPWFPVFVHDAAVLLTGRDNSFPSSVATGTEVEIPGTESSGNSSILKNGTTTELAFKTPTRIQTIGNYSLTRNNTTWHLGGSLLSPGESGPPKENASAPTFQPASGWPLAAWFLLAASLVILAEELLYQRRKVG
ncbi:MAG: BatA and WFA domain-containing protein [Akkermansiaceae bacterium]